METSIIYELEDPSELHELYQTHWWFDGRDLADIRRSVNCSDEFIGLRNNESEELIASARIITDYVFTGKILDVIVDGSLRRRGIETQLMGTITDHPRLRNVAELTVTC